MESEDNVETIKAILNKSICKKIHSFTGIHHTKEDRECTFYHNPLKRKRSK